MSNENKSEADPEVVVSVAAATAAVVVGAVATPAVILAMACAPLALLGAAVVDSVCNKKK